MISLNDIHTATDDEIDLYLGEISAANFRDQVGNFRGEQKSLRDWFAGMESIQECETFEWELCEALAGKRPARCRKLDPVGWEVWQATWQARIKFIRADAMLAARAGEQTETN